MTEAEIFKFHETLAVVQTLKDLLLEIHPDLKDRYEELRIKNLNKLIVSIQKANNIDDKDLKRL